VFGSRTARLLEKAKREGESGMNNLGEEDEFDDAGGLAHQFVSASSSPHRWFCCTRTHCILKEVVMFRITLLSLHQLHIAFISQSFIAH
jgi:hypothetical protein